MPEIGSRQICRCRLVSHFRLLLLSLFGNPGLGVLASRCCLVCPLFPTSVSLGHLRWGVLLSTSVALYPTFVCFFVSLSDLPLGVLPAFLSPRLLCPKTLASSVFQLLLLLKQAIRDYLAFAPAFFVLEMGRNQQKLCKSVSDSASRGSWRKL